MADVRHLVWCECLFPGAAFADAVSEASTVLAAPAGAQRSGARQSRCGQVLDVSGIFQAKGDAGNRHGPLFPGEPEAKTPSRMMREETGSEDR